MRCKRLRTSSADLKRPLGDLWTTNRPHSTGATDHFGTVSTANKKILAFRLPVSVPLISLGRYLTERYSDGCMARPAENVNSLNGFFKQRI